METPTGIEQRGNNRFRFIEGYMGEGYLDVQVNAANVELTSYYHGSKEGSSTAGKQELRVKFGNQKATIDQFSQQNAYNKNHARTSVKRPIIVKMTD